MQIDPRILDSPLAEVRGLGPRRAEALATVGLHTPGDLLRYYPRRYLDRSTVTPIRSLREGVGSVTVVGEVQGKGLAGGGRRTRFELRLTDPGGGTMKAVWFRSGAYIERLFKVGERVALHGKVEKFGSGFSMAHPDFDKLDGDSANLDTGRIISLYPGTAALDKAGLNSRMLRRLVYQIIKEYGRGIEEVLPETVIERRRLLAGNVALRAVHFPKSSEELARARERLKFEELFFLQMVVARVHGRMRKQPGPRFSGQGDLTRRFISEVLPFILTGAQTRSLADITANTSAGVQMNRLLQGDVGSGKTAVAVAAMMMAVDAGYQAAFMAPTEILAEQHAASLRRFLEPLGLRSRLLIGGQRKALREEILGELESGETPVVVGTHALIEDKVAFARLGLVVVDEQHRFGVSQRARIFGKGERPHVLLMSATPIPRSLAMTVYGDLDVSIIDELPAGRKPIETQLFTEKRREEALSLLKDQLRSGRQAFVVFPLVEESESETLADVKSAEQGYEELREQLRPYSVDLVHGRMMPYEKEEAMDRLLKRETDVLVATTVIEVGVDVPNASVMMIEHAERFGLAQLHQLRGRIGRGAHASHCFLMVGHKRSAEANARLEAMLETTDGFRISEMDLQMRGAGDFFGTRQSGLPDLKIADIVRDRDILEAAREEAFEIIDHDPELVEPGMERTRAAFAKMAPRSLGFARIG